MQYLWWEAGRNVYVPHSHPRYPYYSVTSGGGGGAAVADASHLWVCGSYPASALCGRSLHGLPLMWVSSGYLPTACVCVCGRCTLCCLVLATAPPHSWLLPHFTLAPTSGCPHHPMALFSNQVNAIITPNYRHLIFTEQHKEELQLLFYATDKKEMIQ